MRLIPLLLLLTVQSFGQLSPVLNYENRIKIDYYRDSVHIDTLDLAGAFLTIKIDSSNLYIAGVDSFKIILITALPDSVFEFTLNKETRSDSDGIQLITSESGYWARLDSGFLYLEYPRIRRKRNTDPSVPYENSYTSYLFTLVRVQKSVSN